MTSIEDRGLFCSWSGGKDACLALYRSMREGGTPLYLLTTLDEDGKRSRGHKLPVELYVKQAASLGIPLITRATSWEGYEKVLLSTLGDMEKDGVEIGVFGDIDLEEHLEWIERVCSHTGIRARFPLWKTGRRELLEELIDAGFTATVIAVKDGVLDEEFLGRTLTRDTVKEMEMAGIDASGEAGEYHTFVTDGPIFSEPIRLRTAGRVLRDGYWYLEVAVDESNKGHS